MYVDDFIGAFVLVLAFLIQIPDTDSSVYDSTFAMEKLIETQEETFKYFRNVIMKERKRLGLVGQLLSFLMQEHETSLHDVQFYLGNPLNRYSLVERMLRFNSYAIPYLIELKNELIKNKSKIYPSREDFRGALNGITRLQEVYSLEVSDLANGILKGHFSENNETFVEYVTPMTADDCFQLGIAPSPNDSHILATKVKWLKEALVRYREGPFQQFSEKQIFQIIADYYLQMGDSLNYIKWTKKFNPDYTVTELLNDIKNVNKAKEKKWSSEKFQHEKPRIDRWRLRGCYEDLKIDANVSTSCITTVALPTFSRVKIEILHDSPEVLLIHDFLDTTECLQLISIAKNGQMSSSLTVREYLKGFEVVKSNNRTAHLMAVDEEIPLALDILDRLVAITGLNFTSVGNRPLQVVNYGIGGGFTEHTDPYPGEDRIATAIMFLNNVEQGGALVFRRLGVKLYPKPGAAVIFEGMYPSGDVNHELEHAACPVLRGSKWIAVKWAFERHQLSCPEWFYNGEIMTKDRYARFLEGK